MAEAKRVLILAPVPEMAEPFRAAAEKLALELLIGCAPEGGNLRLDFTTRDAALAVVGYAELEPFAAIVAVGDETAPVAARAASILRLPFHTPKCADICRDKCLLKRKLDSSDIPVADTIAPEISKDPVQGVQLAAAVHSSSLEMTLECLMTRGQLRMLVVIEGSMAQPAGALDTELRKKISEVLRRLVPVIGLRHGPVRISFSHVGPKLLVSQVSCACVLCDSWPKLHFAIPLVDDDVSYEELVLRNALDLDTARVFLTGAGRRN